MIGTLFLSTQPDWIQEIFTNAQCESVIDVINDFTSSTHLIAVSDGSAKEKEKEMSHGWILTDSFGTEIASGNGPCDGNISSMRAEAMGMLSVTTFIGTVLKFTNFSLESLEVTFYADNLALITRMQQHTNYDEPLHEHPNQTRDGSH